jgi:hypothetical protein
MARYILPVSAGLGCLITLHNIMRNEWRDPRLIQYKLIIIPSRLLDDEPYRQLGELEHML